MEDNNYTFPQANDLEKVITVMSIARADLIRDRVHIAHILGDVSDRQVTYYVSACVYLGFITPTREFTEYGFEVLAMPRSEKIVEIARRIISDHIFGYVFFMQRLLGIKLEREDIIDLMKKHTVLTEELYKRRAQTVVKWVEWIDLNFPDIE
jgi:hypothetical protein